MSVARKTCGEEVVRRSHAELVRYGLVVWTAGNVSARVPGADLYGDQAERRVLRRADARSDMVVCDLDGERGRGRPRAVQRHRRARLRLPAHARGGRRRAHALDRTPCAWAARGEPVPCVLTAMADEFGGEIPVGPFALIGNDDIGKGIVETLRGTARPPSSCRTTAPFTIGQDREGRGEGGGDVRGRRAAACTSPGSSATRCRSPRPTSTTCTTATRTSTAQAEDVP